MTHRSVVIGAGAVGGYVGAGLAAAGHCVTLIDPWPAHVEAIRAGGIRISAALPLTTASSAQTVSRISAFISGAI